VTLTEIRIQSVDDVQRAHAFGQTRSELVRDAVLRIEQVVQIRVFPLLRYFCATATAPATAWSTSASSNTMNCSLPSSSGESFSSSLQILDTAACQRASSQRKRAFAPLLFCAQFTTDRHFIARHHVDNFGRHPILFGLSESMQKGEFRGELGATALTIRASP